MSKTFAGCFRAVKLAMFAEINAYYRGVESAIILVAITHRPLASFFDDRPE